MLRTRSFILLGCWSFHFVVWGQNGQLVDRTRYTIPEASIAVPSRLWGDYLCIHTSTP